MVNLENYQPSNRHHESNTNQQLIISLDKWALLNGWRKKHSTKGVFVEGFHIKNESTFYASRPGLYFASLQIHFQKPVSGAFFMTKISVTANSQTKCYITEDFNQNYTKTLYSNWVVLIDEAASIQVHIFSSVYISILSKSSFTMQFICSYPHSLGFLASPKQMELLPGAEKQLLVNWKTNIDVGNVFSKSTGNFIVPIDGFYLISLNLVLVNASGEMNVYFSDCYASEDILYHSHSYSNISKTIPFALVKKYFSKTKLTLKVTVENGGIVSSKSQYSIFFIESLTWNPLHDHFYFFFNLMNEEVVKNTGELVKITSWNINTNFVYFNGAFQIASTGYYFVSLKLVMFINETATIKVGFSLNGEEKSSISINTSSSSNIISVANVLFIMQKESLLCHIETSSSLTILPLSSLTIFRIPFPLSNSLYINNAGNSSLQKISHQRYIQFKKALVGHHTKVVLSTDMLSLKVTQDGIFYIVINFFSEKIQEKKFNFSLVYKRNALQQNIWKCVHEDLSSCFLPLVLLLKTSDSLSILQECMSPFYCLENEISILFEIQYLNIFEDSVGVSLANEKNDALEKNKDLMLTFKEPKIQRSVFFSKSISLHKDKIQVIHPGVYSITVVFNIDASVVFDFMEITLELHLHSGSKLKKYYSYQANANSKFLTVSIVKIYYLNQYDCLQFFIKHNLNNINVVKEHYAVSVFMLTNKQSQLATAVISPTFAKSTGDIIFTIPKYSKPSQFVNFLYDFVALKTFVAVTSVVFHLKLESLNNFAEQFVEVYMSKKGQKLFPHFSATKRLFTWSPQVTLQFSGVLLFHFGDIIQINFKVSDGLRFEVLDGTSVMFGILDGISESVKYASYFGFSNFFLPETAPINASSVVGKPGIYVIMLKISSQINKNTSQLLNFNNLHDKISKIWDVTQIILATMSNKTNELIQFVCIYCDNIEIMFLANLESEENIIASINASMFHLNIYAAYHGNELKNFESFNFQNNMLYCNVKAKFHAVYGFEYRAYFQGRYLLIANLFTNENSSVILVIDGRLDDGEVFTTTMIKENLFIHQFNKHVFLNLHQFMEFYIVCTKESEINLLKQSNIAVYRDGILFELFNTNIPVIYVQPSNENNFSPLVKHYQCKAYGKDLNYRWNKILINSGHQVLNVSNSSMLTLSRPSDSGHYFCTASSQGYEIDSSIATFLLQDMCKSNIKFGYKDVPRCNNLTECISNGKSYYCLCKNGYYGDGFNCKDIDECMQENICGKNSVCKNFNGTFSCLSKIDVESMSGSNSFINGSNELNNTSNELTNGSKTLINGSNFHAGNCLSYCQTQYLVSWIEQKPYISIDLSSYQVNGLIKDILDLIIKDVCMKCSNIFFERPLINSKDLLMKTQSNTTDFIISKFQRFHEDQRFLPYPFIPIIERTKVAFFMKDGFSTRRLYKICLIPFSLFLLMVLIGITIWFVDILSKQLKDSSSKYRPRFSNEFFKGSYQGFCWTIAILTNVGVNVNKSPGNPISKMFGIMWMLMSFIMISMITACIIIVMMPPLNSNTENLHGLKVGAVINSTEFQLGFERNAKVIGYHSVADIIEALINGKIDGALLDTLIAREYQKEFSNFKFQGMIKYDFIYGIVLARNGLKLEVFIKSYIKEYQSTIYSILSKAVVDKETKSKILQKNMKKRILFDFHSLLYYQLMLCSIALITSSILVGFLFENFVLRKRKISSKNPRSLLNSPNVVWRGYKIIEYQKFCFKHEISCLKKQIICYMHNWIDRLENIELVHAQKLNTAEKWLSKKR
ncbi:uncharacterized protein LOC105846586 isoform X3 [Hydra vulgaris]